MARNRSNANVVVTAFNLYGSARPAVGARFMRQTGEIFDLGVTVGGDKAITSELTLPDPMNIACSISVS